MKFYTKDDPKQDVCAVGIYFHGLLQDLVGYDVAYVQAPDDREEITLESCGLEEGITNTVVNVDGAYYPAIAYVWQAMNRPRGLVCLANDVDANYEARIAYERKFLSI